MVMSEDGFARSRRARSVARKAKSAKSFRTNRRETKTRRWFRARTALALSSAFTSCTRVLNRPNAQMCCWSSHVTSSALLPCSDTRARRGRGSAGEIGRRSFRAAETNAFETKTRARSTERAGRGGHLGGARGARIVEPGSPRTLMLYSCQMSLARTTRALREVRSGWFFACSYAERVRVRWSKSEYHDITTSLQVLQNVI